MEADQILQLIPKKLRLPKLKKVFGAYQKGLRGKGWNSLYFENHDQPRSVERFAGKYGDLRKEAAKMLAVALYMQQGTPYCYQGQEIGMTNYPWKNWDEFEDVMVDTVLSIINKVAPFLKGYAFKVMKWRARDNARTPMQWNSEKYAGFSTAQPWLPVNPNYTEINVEEALNDKNSIFYFYKEVIKFRKGNEIIINGTYNDLLPKHKDIYCYERIYKGERLLTICNFKNKEIKFTLPAEVVFEKSKLEIHNYGYDREKLENEMTLRPYEAMVFRTI